MSYFFISISATMKYVFILCVADQSFHVRLGNLNSVIPDLEVPVYFLLKCVFKFKINVEKNVLCGKCKYSSKTFFTLLYNGFLPFCSGISYFHTVP